MEGDMFALVHWTPTPSKKDCTAWRSGAYKYAIFVKESIPFIVPFFEDNGLILDASINVFTEIELGKPLCDFLNGHSNILTMLLIDALSNNICAIRPLDMGNTRPSKLLRDTCIEQRKKYKSSVDVAKKIHSLMNDFTTDKMFLQGERFKPKKLEAFTHPSPVTMP
jgi:hypothetical protein